ncbi:MAG: chloride channel protein, partial [Anaerolineales bacterium]|nr:chloride channel protein [Anaerolineales bacterium]
AKVDYSNFLGTLLSSFFSLFSGASVGPEAALGFLTVDVTAWLGDKLKIARQFMPEFLLAGLASTYNGVVGSPLFGTLFATEASGAVSNLLLVGWTLVGGTVGYLVLTLLHIPPFAGYFDVGALNELTPVYILYAVIFGIGGAILALWTGVSLRIAGRVMGVFKDNIFARVLVSGAIIAIIGYFIPDLLFSGEAAVHRIMSSAASYGIPMLLLLALLKPLLLGFSLKGGYLGGAVFPSLYTATMVGLAINLLFPSVPLILILATLQAGMITLVIRAPLTAILLVAAITVANPYLLELITVATATAMIVGAGLQRFRGKGTEGLSEQTNQRCTTTGRAGPATWQELASAAKKANAPARPPRRLRGGCGKPSHRPFPLRRPKLSAASRSGTAI